MIFTDLPARPTVCWMQVTIGCSHNKCTFCNMYKDKQFKVRSADEVIEDLAWARSHYARSRKNFPL